jgi:hypothetical protein
MVLVVEGKDCRGHIAYEISWLITSQRQQEQFRLSVVIVIEFSWYL